MVPRMPSSSTGVFGVLKDRDALDFRDADARRALLAIGEQQNRGRGCNQQHAEGKTFDGVKQCVGRRSPLESCDGMRASVNYTAGTGRISRRPVRVPGHPRESQVKRCEQHTSPCCLSRLPASSSSCNPASGLLSDRGPRPNRPGGRDRDTDRRIGQVPACARRRVSRQGQRGSHERDLPHPGHRSSIERCGEETRGHGRGERRRPSGARDGAGRAQDPRRGSACRRRQARRRVNVYSPDSAMGLMLLEATQFEATALDAKRIAGKLATQKSFRMRGLASPFSTRRLSTCRSSADGLRSPFDH